MPVWLIIAVTAAYVGLLFYIAWRGDAAKSNQSPRRRGIGYALALAVYCTSWTYFGAVGTAASSGWDYIWIYTGPALVFLVFPGVIRRIGDISRRESVSSLSDFLSARYGKSQGVAGLATLAAVMGSVPYIALQLKSVGLAFSELSSGGQGPVALANETVLLTAIAMAVFAIIFGARQSDAARQNPGLMRALSFEAIVKLAALIAVSLLSIALYSEQSGQLAADAIAHFGTPDISGRAMTILLLSMAAIICLPRQFHVSIIERRDPMELNWARWLFPLYLLVTSLVVIPITMAGLTLLPGTALPDLYVLQLPISSGDGVLAMLVFLGGFSAATGMVVVSSITLSSMVTNSIIVPLVLDRGRLMDMSGNGGARLIQIRRVVILVLLLMAYGYFRLAEDSAALAQIGLLSFAAAVQFAPALFGAIYWRRAKRPGVLAGLSIGMAVWIYTLFLPAVFGAGNMAAVLPGPLDPNAILGWSMGDPLTHGVAWSLGLNVLAFVLGSVLATERLRDRVQAVAFTGGEQRLASGMSRQAPVVSVSPDGLRNLAARFLDAEAVAHFYAQLRRNTGLTVTGSAPADWQLVQQTEKLLSRAIGASSARVIMSSAVGGVDIEIDDVLTIFDQKSLGQRFDQHMLQSTLENITQGVSVVDGQQRLVAWNGHYADIFEYPPELLSVGTPISRLIEYNIEKGWIRGDDPAHQARRRVEHMRAGKPHTYERKNPDGRYLRISGAPMPGGGYVSTFTDITEDKRREAELLRVNETLEARVAARTQELRALTEDLDLARQEAVDANASKTRFLAAASHDLLQPLNAARLFLGAMEAGNEMAPLLNKADNAIQSADELLKGLLDISRLNQSRIVAKIADTPLGPLLHALAAEARPMADKAGLRLTVVPTALVVRADPEFLKSILRNFLSNARRYTRDGGIVIGARRCGQSVRIEVWDTGPGIRAERQAEIFEEFKRLEDIDNSGVRGAGLGLAVAQRMAGLMDAEIGLRSEPGSGSVFFVTLDRAQDSQLLPPSREPSGSALGAVASLRGLTVLCVDDEPTILEAMQALLGGWGCNVLTCADSRAAIALAGDYDIDAVIADYQLGADESGIDLIGELRAFMHFPDNSCLLTARRTKAVETRTQRDNIVLLSKPAAPSEILAFLEQCFLAEPVS
ncbi:MAG: PAS domain-containing hybrid sensor histidine kinase/response regulator [Pseudomonadota bacterium]